MNIESKQELAIAILAVREARDRSWDPRSRRYTLPVHSAVELNVRDEDLKTLVLVLLTPGYVEVFEWAEAQLALRADQRLALA